MRRGNRRFRSSVAGLAIGLAGVGMAPVMAGDAFVPSASFVQVGVAAHTHEVAAGLMWDWSSRWPLAHGEVSGYWDASVSRWSYPSPDGRRATWLAQFGATPVLRWRANDGSSPWFVEAGVGATFTTNVYQTASKRFSTRFNFGDHLGVGRNFGPLREHEVAVRLEHFSNAGIKHPNPGENFMQLRYVHRFP